MDTLSKAERSSLMRRIKGRNTTPEKKIRSALYALGYRYRLNVKSLPGTPDIVLRKYRYIIEVRGCFWHLHGCKRSSIPKTNSNYWISKLKRNVARDRRNLQKLKKMGWHISIVWECQTGESNKLTRLVNKIAQKLKIKASLLPVTGVKLRMTRSRTPKDLA